MSCRSTLALLTTALLGFPLVQGAEEKSPLVNDYYEVETIPLPDGEVSVDALAFLPDGRLA